MAYSGNVILIETSVFTKEIKDLLSDEENRMLQTALMFRPDAGDIVRGGGGLRKVRWNLPGMGKRGGLRVIYYWDPPDAIYMILPYKKTDQDDLTSEQLKFLRNMVKECLT
jgi:hypothetical protein